jgi:hypothetical protein
MAYEKNNDVLGSSNRGNPAESGLCTLCRADCKGKCETWLSSMKGREMLYPRDFGFVTTGSVNKPHVGIGYDSLRITGNLYGAYGLPKGISSSADDSIFTNVSTETEFGNTIKMKSRLPIMTGALGSTFIAQKYWESIAIGAALVGIPIVVGENVVGVDKESEIKGSRLIKAPELDRRIDTYLKYYDGYGAIMVQMNVEDSNNGLAEYLIEKYGNQIALELKWGQGAKDIGGEIQVKDIEYASFLKKRGYIVDPDPDKAEVQKAFKNGAIKLFARHSRLGYTDLSSIEEVENDFMKSIERLRKLGYEKITLKTGAYGMEALAMAIKLATNAELDLLTVDGSGGGTGMSPWNMMENWGTPSILLHSKAYEYASILAARVKNVVDMAFAGGLAREDHIFKALALGAPYTKLVCMGRALMIPGFLGSNIEGALFPERREILSGNWDQLPKAITDNIGYSPEKIFAGYYDVRKKVGAEEMKSIPYGAIAVWTLADKLGAGLQQLMAGARKFSVPALEREDIVSCNRETEQETKINFITESQNESAINILKG